MYEKKKTYVVSIYVTYLRSNFFFSQLTLPITDS